MPADSENASGAPPGQNRHALDSQLGIDAQFAGGLRPRVLDWVNAAVATAWLQPALVGVWLEHGD